MHRCNHLTVRVNFQILSSKFFFVKIKKTAFLTHVRRRLDFFDPTTPFKTKTDLKKSNAYLKILNNV